MAKISELPRIPAGEADGSELLPVVRDGATMAAPVGDFIAPAAMPFVNAAAISAAAAEAAGGPTYASTAEGLAATTVGQAFAVNNGDGTVSVYRHDAGGVATFQRRLPTTEFLASANGARAIGIQSGTVEDAVTVAQGQTLAAAKATPIAARMPLASIVQLTDRPGLWRKWTAGMVALDPVLEDLCWFTDASGAHFFYDPIDGIHSPEAYGATGGANDTVALQAAFNNARTISLMPGRVYNVTNLTRPLTSNWTLLMNGAEIRAVAGGDTYYLFADIRHVTNIPNAQSPGTIVGPGTFNGNGIVNHAIIWQGWRSSIGLGVAIEVKGATSHGVKFAARIRAGNTFPSSSLVNSAFNLHSHHNGGWGFYVDDPLRNNATDGELRGRYYGNMGGAYIDAGAGWDISIQSYSNTAGGTGTGTGLELNGAGQGTRIYSCYLDEADYALLIRNNINVGIIPVGPGNIFKQGKVSNKGTGNTAPNGLRSFGNTYQSGARLYHEYFAPSRKNYSDGDTFESDTPAEWHDTSSTGEVIFSRAFLRPSGRMIEGVFNAVNRSRVPYSVDRIRYNKSVSVAAAAISQAFDVPPMSDYDMRFAHIRVVTRTNWYQAKRVVYEALVDVCAAVNGTNAWVASLTNVIFTAAEWSVAPAIAVADSGGTGTITFTGTPATLASGVIEIAWGKVRG